MSANAIPPSAPPLRPVVPPKAVANPLPRIEALTRNARTTWLALLSVLAFVGITLTGVEHVDFYGVGRATKLPFIDVTVPTYVFFYAAPVLTAAAYGYFHLYLIRLWEVLGPAPSHIDGAPLGEKAPPWLVTDAALHLRARKRGDGSAAERPFERMAMLLNILLAWGFGLFILGAIWWVSMPARDAWMTGVAALALAVSTALAYVSWRVMWLRMRDPGVTDTLATAKKIRLIAMMIVAVPVLGVITYGRTVDPVGPVGLARIAMPGAAIVEKPAGWLPYQNARTDHLDAWCRRPGITCPSDGSWPEGFLSDWQVRRTAALGDQTKPRWHAEGAAKPDWRDADLRGVYLSGADLRGAQMQGADLSFAQMEGANLFRAQMEGADLSGAQMEGADLSGAQMEGADLSFAQMEGANLSGAQMQGAHLSQAQMQGADLIGAQMQGANLSGAQMEGADLSGAQMQGADLSGAQMQGADLRGAQMQGADLSYSLLTGTPDGSTLLQSANLSAGINNGGALRFADLTQVEFDHRTDFRNAFLDGSVRVPDGFRAKMGDPCQWTDEILSDAVFYGRWRWWLQQDPDGLRWEFVAPEDWRDVPVNDPGTDCEWKTGPMPGTETPDP